MDLSNSPWVIGREIYAVIAQAFRADERASAMETTSCRRPDCPESEQTIRMAYAGRQVEICINVFDEIRERKIQ